MFENTGMMRNIYLLERGMDVETVRRRVVANNIANVDVPHFKRSEVNFESELRRVIDDNASRDNRYQGVVTDPRHIPFYVERDVRDVSPRINLDYNTTQRNDGNNVDMEKEIVDAAMTQMRYNAFVTRISGHFSMLKTAMRQI